MQIVGLTGNIGSGKSTIVKAFAALGVPVFNSDEEAKKAYAIPSIQQEVQSILGLELNFNKDEWKNEIAQIIFSNTEKRTRLESLIHKFVYYAFENWKQKQNSNYIIRESALANSFQPENCDWLIEVIANKSTRLQRVIERSGLSEDEFNKRDSLQNTNKTFPEARKFTISNNNSDSVLNEILKINQNLSS